jgi:hypothetical protein
MRYVAPGGILARYDADHPHPTDMGCKATKHAIADGLAVFGGVEVLEVEALLEEVVLDVQETGQMRERPPHEHPAQQETARAAAAEVEVAGLVDVQVERAARRV